MGGKLDLFRLGRFLVSRLLGSMFSVGGNADDADLAETHGFFNCVVFNNCVENLRITTDFMAAVRPSLIFGYHPCYLE